jgi:hypothetical protein
MRCVAAFADHGRVTTAATAEQVYDLQHPRVLRRALEPALARPDVVDISNRGRRGWGGGATGSWLPVLDAVRRSGRLWVRVRGEGMGLCRMGLVAGHAGAVEDNGELGQFVGEHGER